jgi:hypothetical protein
MQNFKKDGGDSEVRESIFYDVENGHVENRTHGPSRLPLFGTDPPRFSDLTACRFSLKFLIGALGFGVVLSMCLSSTALTLGEFPAIFRQPLRG